MKKYLLLLSIVIMGLSACKKGDVTAEQAVVDDAKIQAYIAANLSASSKSIIKDPSGIYYMVIKPGTGGYPTVNSTVQVSYTGKLLNGTTFETISNTILPLSGTTMKGWQIGVPKINSGTVGVTGSAGRLLLIIPSGLANGTAASASIPTNSILLYTIDLLGFTN